MAGKKFLQLKDGFATEVSATQQSTGATNGGDLVALNDQGKLDDSVLPTGIGADMALLTASEALAAGDFVNIYNNAGTANMRKADASGGIAKMAHGFVKANVASGAQGAAYFEGTNDQVSGLTPGNVWLSATTAGKATNTPPTGASVISQPLGTAISATSVNAEISKQPIVQVG